MDTAVLGLVCIQGRAGAGECAIVAFPGEQKRSFDPNPVAYLLKWCAQGFE